MISHHGAPGTSYLEGWRRSIVVLLLTSLAVGASGAFTQVVWGAVDDASIASTEIADFAFEPDIVVAAGTQIRWLNRDGVAHTVTADDGSFDSGSVPASGTFEQVFSEPGVITYACTIHPSMTGTITVEPADEILDPRATRDDELGSGATTLLQRTAVFDTDPLGIGGRALTILVPEGWSVEGGPVWRHQYSNLATFEGRVASPDLLRGVEFFAIFPQIWQEGGITFFPQGSNYLGNDVRPPIRDIGVFLETLILPAYRRAFEPRIIERVALPEVAAQYVGNSLPGTEVAAERVLTEHFVNYERMLEEFTVVLRFTPGLAGTVFWSAEQLFSIRAPAAEFDATRPLLQAVATSPQLDLEWYASYDYVLRLSRQNGLDAIRAAGAASRIIAESNAEINDIIISGYQERQAADDRIFDAVSQTIRGVETYRGPFAPGGTLELPNGYENAYASNTGSVILSNEPGFDPARLLPDQTWELLTVER